MGPLSSRVAWRSVAAVAALIASIDLLQVFVLGKGLGAIGGAVLYATVAVALVREQRWAAWVVLLMPVVPLAVISGSLGEQLRSELVDAPMVAVAVLQSLASLGASGLLFAARFRTTR